MSQPKLLRRDIKPVENSIALLNSDALYNKFNTFLTSDNLSIKGGGASATLSNVVNITNNHTKITYPVGSVYVTYTNSSPASYLGGTWALFDKEFTNNKSLTLAASNYTLNSTNCSTVSGYAYYFGHCIELQIVFTPTVAITDTELQMFTFNMESIGAKAFRHTTVFSGLTDAGNSVISYKLTPAGILSTTDVIVRGSSTASLATGYTPQVRVLMPVTYTNMVDSFCNKFYWRRTA